MYGRTTTAPSSTRSDSFRVALVCMPFGFLTTRPSIQMGLLQAIADQEGFATDTHHLFLELAARLTPPVFDTLCNRRLRMTSEWLFSVAAFGSEAPADDAAYFTAFPEEIDLAKQLGKDL